MGTDHLLPFLSLVKIYAVEICGTVVFVVFVAVEAIKAIHHILRPDRLRAVPRKSVASGAKGGPP